MDNMQYVELHGNVDSSEGSADFDSLVDSVLQYAPAEGEAAPAEEPEGPAAGSRIDPRDRKQLRELYGQLMSQYLDPIAQFVRMIRRGERSKEVLESFRNLLQPVQQLTETLEEEQGSEIVQHLYSHIELMFYHQGTLTWRHLEPLSELFDQLLNSLGPEIRDQYLSACYYQRNSNPLLEEIRRVKFIGPRRLQRLYSVGLVTVEAISRATPQDIVDVTGLSLKLAEQVIEVTKAFMVQQRVNRKQRIKALMQDLREELAPLTERDQDLFNELPGELELLMPALNRVKGWTGRPSKGREERE